MTDHLTRFCVDNPELHRLGELIGEFDLFEAAGLRRDEVGAYALSSPSR